MQAPSTRSNKGAIIRVLTPALEQDIAATQLFAQQHIARRIHAVKLEDVLRNVQTDRGNLLHGRPRQMGVVINDLILAR